MLYVGELLAETVKDDDARRWLLDRVVTEADLGRDLALPVRSFFDDADPSTVATHLIGGITVDELPAGTARGLAAGVVGGSGFVLPPLPNHDPQLAVKGANAVYTDVWVSMGDRDDERAARSEALRPYRVDAALMGMTHRDAVFLHCLPAHRGDEVAAEVIDGPRSLVFDQAEIRMHTAQVLLEALVLGQLEGAGEHAEVR